MADTPARDFAEFSRRPFVLRTNLIRHLIPGGALLPRFLGEDSNAHSADQPSQMWVASTVTSVLGSGGQGLSRLAGDEGVYLKTLLDSRPDLFLGSAHAAAWGGNPAFLVKLLNSRERLLVQVHPDRQKARRYFGLDFGKTEAWYVVDAEQGALAYAGFRPGVTRDVLRRAIAEQDSDAILGLLHAFPLAPGDVLFIPGGLAHALGSGSLVVEIQEPTDITLRAERRTPLGTVLTDMAMHGGAGMEAMLDCFDYSCLDFHARRRRVFVESRTLASGSGFVEESLLSDETTPWFGMSAVTLEAGCEYRKQNDSFVVAIVIDGEGTASGGGVRIPLRRSTELFIPNGVKEYAYATEQGIKVIECHPPTAGGWG